MTFDPRREIHRQAASATPDDIIERSTRHQKIIGLFGEALICNWLSRSGWEVTLVDHTGIDIVAFRPRDRKRLGITVKSRTRPAGRERVGVSLFWKRKGQSDRVKLLAACDAFACEPWIGVYVEAARSADLYLTSLTNYDAKYRAKGERAIEVWRMTEAARREYARDPGVFHIRMEFDLARWFPTATPETCEETL